MKRSLVTGGCGFVGRHLTRRLLGRGGEVWIVDDLSTGIHPDAWLAQAKRTDEGPAVRYCMDQGNVMFLRDDALAFFLRQIHTANGSDAIRLPEFDEVYALASVVGGRKKIDGDPMEVAIDLGIDAAFFLWAVRNRERVGRILSARSSAAYPINLQKATGHVALNEGMIDFASGDLGQPDMTYGWSKLTG